MQETEKQSDWDEIIKPKRGLLELNLKAVWKYRDLLTLLVRRDFVAVYKQTILGPLWHFLQPIFTTITFTIIFSNVAQIPTDEIPAPMFYYTGTIIWNFFSKCLTTTSSTFVSNAGIFGKVYFPRLIMPLSAVASAFIAFLIQCSILIVMYIVYSYQGANLHISIWTLTIPLLLIIMAMLGLGLGIIISSFTTKYKDLNYFLGFGVQLLMYATPIIYPASFIPAPFNKIVMLNPIAPVIEGFKFAVLGKGTFDFKMLTYSVVVTTIIFFIGLITFNRVEKKFIDTI